MHRYSEKYTNLLHFIQHNRNICTYGAYYIVPTLTSRTNNSFRSHITEMYLKDLLILDSQFVLWKLAIQAMSLLISVLACTEIPIQFLVFYHEYDIYFLEGILAVSSNIAKLSLSTMSEWFLSAHTYLQFDLPPSHSCCFLHARLDQ